MPTFRLAGKRLKDARFLTAWGVPLGRYHSMLQIASRYLLQGPRGDSVPAGALLLSRLPNRAHRRVTRP